MHIIIKLIGHIINEDSNNYCYELKIYNLNILSFDIIKTIFGSYGLEEEEFENITVTCEYKNIKNESITSINNNEEKKVYIYTCKEKIIHQLKEIFVLHGHKTLINSDMNIIIQKLDPPLDSSSVLSLDSSSVLSLDSSSVLSLDSSSVLSLDSSSGLSLDSPLDLSLADFSEINKETIKIFDDPDFIFLIKIYLNKPDMFKTFFKYISSRNIIIKQSEKKIDDSIIDKSFIFIKNLNLDLSDEIIKEALYITNNHLNLSIRYLLLKKVEENI
jgi:hypothetical protein